MSRAMRACVIRANLAGIGFARGLGVEVAGSSPRLGNRRDGVFENQLFLGARFQQDRELVEATDAAGELGAVQQVDHDGDFLATYCVEKGVLYVLWCLFAVRHG